MSWGTQEQQQKSCIIFVYGTVTFYGASFQKLQLTIQFLTPLEIYVVVLQPLATSFTGRLPHPVKMVLGLGFFLFARRYLGNTICFFSSWYWDVSLPRVRFPTLCRDYRGLLYRVSPFGNLRINSCYTLPRSLSQLRHVLHRLLKSRHPPYALKFPVKKFRNHNFYSLYFTRPLGCFQALCLGREKTSRCPDQSRDVLTGFCYQAAQ